ncbi:hypothetical protein HS7_01760 [Sulfolobales archaeon HS-7]|nr:hypothetical protein HS7_01760 [Sulfolobales archaeon HS-7]
MQLEVFVTIAYSVVLLVTGFGVMHAVEPDHIVTLRSAKNFNTVWKFALSHGLGFLIIGIPIVLILGYLPFLDIAGDIFGIGISIVFLYSLLANKEIEFGFKTGIVQGGLALTPSKVLVAILASDLGLLNGVGLLLLFTVVSSLTLLLVGKVLPNIPLRITKAFDILISIGAIAYLVYVIVR